MRQFMNSILIAGMMLLWTGAQAQKNEQAPIPTKVMETLHARFPRHEINKWTKEKEGEIVMYDFEFRYGGRQCEADIKEDGTIHNWEKAITAGHLPAAVRETVERTYPKSKMKEIMEITSIKNGKDELEGYEIVLRTREKKDVEVTVASDGRILEDSTDKK